MILKQNCSKIWNPCRILVAMATKRKETFKHLLVRSHWTDFSITWQKCCFCDPLTRLFKPSWFVKKHGHQGPGLIFPISLYRKLKKSSCSYTTGLISIQLGRNVPLMTLYQDYWCCNDLSKHIATRWRGLYSLYNYIENFKNLLIRNHWTDFNIIWQKCSFGDHLPRVLAIMICQKHYC